MAPDPGGGVRLSVPDLDSRHHRDQVWPAPEGLPSLDDTDRQLIALLLDDGRLSNRSLAAEVGVSEATVGSRLKRLVADGLLVFSTIIDWEAAGYQWFAIARINVEGRAPRAVAEEISSIPNCMAVSVVFGSVDVLAYFLLEDREGIHRLVDQQLAAVPGVAQFTLDLATESFVTIAGQNAFLARTMHPLRLPNPAVPLDSLDVRLLEQLLLDGRKPSRKIGRELGVSEGTIRFRMGRLAQARLIRVVAMVDPLAIGTAGVIADVGLHVRRDMLGRVMDQILTIPEVVFAATTIGSADISVAVAAASRAHLLEVILDRIRAVEGVRTTATLEMVDVVHFVPYFKRLR
jgi:DNA-binding Lrp family transcriptional regulator